MHLYYQTLTQPLNTEYQNVPIAILVGKFSNEINQQAKSARDELLLVSHGYLTLFRQNEETKLMEQVMKAQNVFGQIRSADVLKIENGHAVVLGTCSGGVSLLKMNQQDTAFELMKHEIFGKTGCRRIVPGQYVTVDPSGRALFVGALENQIFGYVLDRDSDTIEISSPLSAHQPKTIFFAMVALDVGLSKPLMAVIEQDYSKLDEDSSFLAEKETQRVLSFYELDLGNNTISKRDPFEIPATSHYLIPVPGGKKYPGGVLVCSEQQITYFSLDETTLQTTLPRRKNSPLGRNTMIVNHALVRLKKSGFFFLVQTESGDLLKIQLVQDKDNAVDDMEISYFATIPVCSQLQLLITGYLYAGTEFGDQYLYAFESVDSDIVESSVTETVSVGGDSLSAPVYTPRDLQNLKLVQTFPSLSPTLEFQAQDFLNENSKQLYCLAGRGNRSSVRILKNGLKLEKINEIKLKEHINDIWTLRESEKTSIVIIGYEKATQVIQLTEEKDQFSLKSVKSSGFKRSNTKTITAGIAGNNSQRIFVQVHQRGALFIRNADDVETWDSDINVVFAVMNESQLLVGLAGGTLVYFEYNEDHDTMEEQSRHDMGQDVACMCIGAPETGEIRSKYCAVGLFDKTIKILNLRNTDMWSLCTTQVLAGEPSSLSLTQMTVRNVTSHYLHVGTTDGVLQRTTMNIQDGTLKNDAQQKFLGNQAVQLKTIEIDGERTLLAISNRAYLFYRYHDEVYTHALSVANLTSLSNLDTATSKYFIGALGKVVRIYKNLSSIGQLFHQEKIDLNQTPRQIVVHPDLGSLILIETDHNSYPQSENDADAMIDESETANNHATVPLSGKWSSYIRILEKGKEGKFEKGFSLELPNNEAAFSAAICKFSTSQYWNNEKLLVVGTAKDMTLYPRQCECGFLRVYRFVRQEDSLQLELVHMTKVEDVPLALRSFQGMLLAGIKSTLRLYTIGSKQLLIKTENSQFPSFIRSVTSQDFRIFVSDAAESILYVKYKSSCNQLIIFADNNIPRWLTATCQLDYDTLAGADKFGNFFVTRLPKDIDDNSEYTRKRAYWDNQSQKSVEIVQFHVGDIITCLKRVNMLPGTPGMIMGTTITGHVVAFVPFSSPEDVEFFSRLEIIMRNHVSTLSGRDHLSYRSSYHPCRCVIDGDLIQLFSSLDEQTRDLVITDMEMEREEILQKIDMIQNRIC